MVLINAAGIAGVVMKVSSNRFFKKPSEESLERLLSKSDLLELEVSYKKNEGVLQFKALIDADEKGFLKVIHECWDCDDCILKKTYRFFYDPEKSIGDAGAFFDSLELSEDIFLVQQ